MIIFFLQIILFTYLISSTFTVTHVVDTEYDENKADHARNTSLAVAILTGFALLVINLVYYLKYIESYRVTIILIFVNLVTAILSLISYLYLEEQRKSPPQYQTKERELNDAAETRNEKALKFSYYTGLINICILGLICAYLLGHGFLSEKEFIRIDKPKLYNTSRGRERGNIYNNIKHNFIV